MKTMTLTAKSYAALRPFEVLAKRVGVTVWVSDAKPSARVYVSAAPVNERNEAFERLMNFPRAEFPAGFDYKKELMEAIDERFNGVD